MLLIVGLGNPGEKYKNNRHNAGYLFIDHLFIELASYQVSEFKKDKYTNSQLAKLAINNKEIVLIKPQTFMNNSGAIVNSCVNRYALHVKDDLIVAHDDLDIPLGMFKIQKGVGPKLHNGLESIENHLHTRDFWRIRIGVDNRPAENRINGEAYVLQNFTVEEKNILNRTFSKIFAYWIIFLKTQFSITI